VQRHRSDGTAEISLLLFFAFIDVDKHDSTFIFHLHNKKSEAASQGYFDLTNLLHLLYLTQQAIFGLFLLDLLNEFLSAFGNAAAALLLLSFAHHHEIQIIVDHVLMALTVVLVEEDFCLF
jgi:hypothetical protein